MEWSKALSQIQVKGCVRSQVQIPTLDYNIAHSELEITCHYAPKSEPALELHSMAAPSVEAHHCVSGPHNRKKFRRKADSKKIKTENT